MTLLPRGENAYKLFTAVVGIVMIGGLVAAFSWFLSASQDSGSSGRIGPARCGEAPRGFATTAAQEQERDAWTACAYPNLPTGPPLGPEDLEDFENEERWAEAEAACAAIKRSPCTADEVETVFEVGTPR